MSPKTSPLDYSRIASLLATPQRIAITTHKSPDGDAIGSSLGLAGVLRKVGHEVSVIVPDDFPDFLHWMNGAADILVFQHQEDEATKVIQDATIVFSLDYNRLDRVGDVGDVIAKSSATKMLIDHHIDPATDFDFSLSDVSASSTAELVYRFLSGLSLLEHIGSPESEALYAGIMTDTGSFRFSSTSAATHEIAADLLSKGVRPEMVHQQIFDSYSFQRLKLMGYALGQKLSYDPELRAAILPLNEDEKKRFGFNRGDTEGLVNYGLSIKGSRLSVFLSEERGYIKFSFRSKGDLDVNVIAREHFNGGGHKNAAGGRLESNMADALALLKTVIHEKLS